MAARWEAMHAAILARDSAGLRSLCAMPLRFSINSPQAASLSGGSQPVIPEMIALPACQSLA